MNIPVYVTTCNRYLWALRPFSYLFNLYWSELQHVVVIGFTRPDYNLPANFEFYSAGEDTGQKSWSTALMRALHEMDDELFTLLLDDYWLQRTVDTAGVATLADYMQQHPRVLRMDLTTDRLYAGGMFDVEAFGHYDILETPPSTPYQMSTQAGIWRRSLLLELLRPEMTPWEVELQTDVPGRMRVLGTRQSPVRYANVFRGGDPDTLLNLEQIPGEHIEELRRREWIK
jgi:hypothetical protein